MPTIKLKDYSFSYHERNILNGINLSIKENMTVGIIGLSGSGKTTLLKRISGIETGTGKEKGSMLVDNMSPEAYLKKRVTSYMFQEPTLIPYLNIKENIEFPLRALEIEINNNLTRHYLELIGLIDYQQYLPKQLSGGMKTRVALARSFISKPKLMMLDEPFSSLDIGWQMDLYNKLQLFQSETLSTILLVTHNIIEALYLCNNIYILGRSGKIINQIDIEDELPRKYDLRETSFNLKNYYDMIWETLEKDKSIK
jgi:ABC-type nitrate/sulfonate/bicarbonate transport system ATPase subunit